MLHSAYYVISVKDQMSYTTKLTFGISDSTLEFASKTVCAPIYLKVSRLLVMMGSAAIGRRSGVVIIANNREHLGTIRGR